MDFRFLPEPGGLMDQPLDLLEDIAYLESIWGYYERMERERERRPGGPVVPGPHSGGFHDFRM